MCYNILIRIFRKEVECFKVSQVFIQVVSRSVISYVPQTELSRTQYSYIHCIYTTSIRLVIRFQKRICENLRIFKFEDRHTCCSFLSKNNVQVCGSKTNRCFSVTLGKAISTGSIHIITNTHNPKFVVFGQTQISKFIGKTQSEWFSLLFESLKV